MTRIYLIRHGQTEWNRQERFRGRLDVPLNAIGHAQAAAIAAHLCDRSITVVYTSPLQRTVETARPIATAHQLTPHMLPGLIDIDYGQWQGLTPAEVRRVSPDLLDLWYTQPHTVKIPAGGSLEAVRTLALPALCETLSDHDGESLAFVTHQIVIKVLTRALLGLDMNHIWRIQQDNGCIDIFDWDGKQFTAVLINGTAHLPH